MPDQLFVAKIRTFIGKIQLISKGVESLEVEEVQSSRKPRNPRPYDAMRLRQLETIEIKSIWMS